MSATAYVYGVFTADKWGLAYNRQRAIAQAQRLGGYVVRNRYQAGDVWDSPTFAHVGELIADFTKEQAS